MLYLKKSYNFLNFLKHIIVTPIIYSIAIPLVFLDIWIEIYHRICFPLYGFSYVKRKKYIKVIDRGKLKYLDFFQKMSCMYCGYANGVVRYWQRIAAETELYWCGIKHERGDAFMESEHQKDFSEYGDEDGFKAKYLQDIN